MPCAFGCNMCNRCGKFTDLLAMRGKRLCPACQTKASDEDVVCRECGAVLPPVMKEPGQR